MSRKIKKRPTASHEVADLANETAREAAIQEDAARSGDQDALNAEPLTGEQETSVLFSNLGKINLPPEMMDHVKLVEVMAGPGRLNAVRCAGCGIGDKFIIDFANIYAESDIERRFFTSLVKMGVHVKIESNRR